MEETKKLTPKIQRKLYLEAAEQVSNLNLENIKLKENLKEAKIAFEKMQQTISFQSTKIESMEQENTRLQIEVEGLKSDVKEAEARAFNAQIVTATQKGINEGQQTTIEMLIRINKALGGVA